MSMKIKVLLIPMKMKKYILSFLVAFCFLSFGYTQQSGYYYPDNSNRWTGRVNNLFQITDDELLIGKTFSRRGWAKFNITNIPDNATILQVDVQVYVNSASSEPSSFELVLSSLYVDPATASASTLWDNIDNLPDYFESSSWGDAVGTKTETNVTTMNDDVQSSLSKNWFAIGFFERYEDASDCHIDGHTSANRPSLNIHFDLPAPTGVSATDGSFCDRVILTWNAVTNADAYYIYRGNTYLGWTSNLYFDDMDASISSQPYRVYAAKTNAGTGHSSKYGGDSGYKKSVLSQPGLISGSISVCQGSTQTYSISPVSGATSYTWILPSGWSGSSSINFINADVGASSGTISVTANNSCGPSTSRALNITVTLDPSQPGAITGATSVCQGSSHTYSISSVSGATSYNWTLPSGWSGSSSSTSIIATAGASGGTISVAANNSCGSGTSRTLAVGVTSTPSQPGAISGSTSVCPGSTNTYSISSVSGATSYTWTLPSGWSGSSTSTSIIATAGASGGTISVTANNSCGSGTSRTLAVGVTSTPSQPGAISGSTSVCPGSTNTYSISSVSDATSYTWTLPSGWSGSSTSTSIIATAGASGGTISVAANNSCGSGTSRTLTVGVKSTPSQPGAITGATSVCQGSSHTYSISSVSGATSYTWTLPSGWSGSSSSTSIIATAGASGGTISVAANNSCGSGTSRTLAVGVTSTTSQPGAITGATSVCQGSSHTYSISSVSGATSYTWTLPSGWSGSSTSTSIIATAGASGGIISVTSDNSCGSSTPRTLTISVTALLNQPGSISGPTSVTQGVSYAYSIVSVSGATSYTWQIPSGWSGSSSSTSIIATAGANGGDISVAANNSCGSSTPRTLTVMSTCNPPSQPGSMTGSAAVCQGSSYVYSISSVSGATSYTWTLPSGWSGNSSSTSITATAGAGGGTISVAANNSCGSGTPRTKSIVMAVKPTITTSNVSTLSFSTATAGGNITSNGGEEVTVSGVCWSTSPNPTTSNSKTTNGTTIGNFTSTIIGLIENETYYIRAYATNCSGTGYGSNIEYNNTNVIEVIQSTKISIFPNPVSGILNIEYKDGTYKSINIINPQGILLKTEKVVSPSQQVDFSKYEYGLYILEFVKPGGEKERVRVIKH
jgi:hypothetical protein